MIIIPVCNGDLVDKLLRLNDRKINGNHYM